MRYVFVIGMIAVGCQDVDSPEVWRDCDEAFGALDPPMILPTESVLPLEVGQSMPVLRISAPPTDADRVANRALAMACVLADGDAVATTQLPVWAEQAVAGESHFEESGVTRVYGSRT